MAACDPFDERDMLTMLNSKSFEVGNRTRNQCLFVLECCTGARISEILGLRRGDMLDDQGHVRDRITFTRTKNKRPRTVPLVNDFLKPYLVEWLKLLEADGYCQAQSMLFPSYKQGRAITRAWAWCLYKSAAKELGLSGTFGTHSCRKAWAKATYEYYHRLHMAGKNIDPLVKLQEAGGWRNIDSCRRYLAFMLGDYADSQKSLFKAFSKEYTKS
jgi:integrase